VYSRFSASDFAHESSYSVAGISSRLSHTQPSPKPWCRWPGNTILGHIIDNRLVEAGVHNSSSLLAISAKVEKLRAPAGTRPAGRLWCRNLAEGVPTPSGWPAEFRHEQEGVLILLGDTIVNVDLRAPHGPCPATWWPVKTPACSVS
jgi:glucose-1-phosphate thymidylyltransferase